jgi:hypothetical protein
MPGVLVTAIQADRHLRTITDAEGAYFFPDITGNWTIQVVMPGFAPTKRDLVILPEAQATVWELEMLPLSNMSTEMAPGLASPSVAPVSETTAPLLITGSVSNGQSGAFGNNRRRGPSPYTADLNLTADSSAFDARPFSLTGQETPQSAYTRSEGSIVLSGPIWIPFLVGQGPQLTLIYGRAQNRNAGVQAARMPTLSERAGDFSTNAKQLIDPFTGSPFSGNVIPQQQLSPQALALVRFYPAPNVTSERGYNYQAPVAGVTHRDDLQLQTGGTFGGQQLSGGFGYQSTRTDSGNLFGFVDNLRNTAVNGILNWSRRFSPGLSVTGTYAFRRNVTQALPYFAGRENVSGNAGITGNAQAPHHWGPPHLNFSSGIATLWDGQYAFDRTQSNALSSNSTWSRGPHSLSFGAGFLGQQFSLLSEQDARGTFVFTGAASGVDFADFLLGVPAASSIAFGNAERYFRQSNYDGFIMDDWRPTDSLSFNLGVRWEYETPVTERYGRLVNLDIVTGFGAVEPVLASEPRGALTGQLYPASLVRSDKAGIQPRVGLAWRPLTESSLVIRAGYGIYRNTAVYRSIADEMAQQPPFSTRLSVENRTASPLTLANGFVASPLNTPSTFAVDSGFRVGYAQNWQLSLQHDLPAALQMTATYVGIKGTHLQRRRLPNSLPPGASLLPCTTCPAGYVYLTSDGNSTQHAGTIQLRRRQKKGFAGTLEYTWSKAIDDSGMGDSHIAQDWRDRRAERALSGFDQRHRITAQALYTTGTMAGIGPLSDGRLGALLRQWTVMTEWRANSGSPLTPILVTPVQGTAFTGSLRPDRTTDPIYPDTPGTLLNAGAYSPPALGKWGNAGRNSIAGPWGFALDASIGRVFYLGEGIGIDLRVDVTNVLNHVTFSSWNTVINSAQFGLPISANTMRTVRPSLRVRF